VDGFEFAKQLRGHPRFESTPIIFVSAMAHSERDQLHGYASGAVDYVTAPVVPEMLRAKVKVFADLYRKQRELEALKAELETRVAARTSELAASEARYRTLVDGANDIVATLDLKIRFTSVNPAVERILGYAPEEVIGTSLSKFVPEDQLAVYADMFKRKLEGISRRGTRYNCSRRTETSASLWKSTRSSCSTQREDLSGSILFPVTSRNERRRKRANWCSSASSSTAPRI